MPRTKADDICLDSVAEQAETMTKFVKGYLNMGVLYLIGVCNNNQFDSVDYLILSWIYAFLKSGKIFKKVMFDKDLKRKTEFFWVHYSEVMKQLPSIRLKSTRSIANRMDKYVECGVMKKNLVANPNGTYTMFRFVPEVLELMANADPKAYRLVPGYYQFEPLMCLSELGATDPLETGLQSAETNMQSEEISFGSEESSFGGKEIGSHPNYYNVNNTVVNNTTVTITAIQQQNLIHILNELFGNAKVFTDDFIPSLIAFFERNGITDDEKQKKYLKFIVENAKKHSSGDLKGYVYKTACQDNLLAQFIELNKEEERRIELQTVTCPVCGTSMKKYSECSKCGLNYLDFGNERREQIARETLAELEGATR